MAKIIPFPKQRSQASDLIEEILETRLGDKSPEVLQCLKLEMRQLVEKYFPGEEMAVSLTLPNDLSGDQFQMIEESFRKVFKEHNNKLLHRSNRLFFDLCLSRMQICELKHSPPKE